MSRRWLLLLLISCLVSQYGCAVLQPATPMVAGDEFKSVTEAFFAMRERQRHCGCCLDAELAVTLSVTRWLGSGSSTISGYVQAMEPSYLKFAGINPLGQPQILLTIADQQFQWAVVPAATVYSGPVSAGSFVNHSPAGFNPEGLYFWLTGRLPAEALTISQARVSEEQPGCYWLRLDTESGPVGRVLFDPVAGTLSRRILEDDRGRLRLSVRYEDYQQVDGCLYPARITINSPAQNSGAEAVLSGFAPKPVFTADHFRFESLPDFEQILVR